MSHLLPGNAFVDLTARADEDTDHRSSAKRLGRLHHPMRGAGVFRKHLLPALEGPRDQVEKRFNAEAVVEKLDHLFEGESGLLAGNCQFVDGGIEEWSLHVGFSFWGIAERVTRRWGRVCDLDHHEE